MSAPVTDATALVARRAALHQHLSGPALLAAGAPLSRNFPANTYPFRASSHFLYFAGRPLAEAALLFHDGRTTLFAHQPDAEDALWHGPRPSLDQLRDDMQLDAVKPLGALDAALAEVGAVATLPTEDARSAAWLSARLGRAVAPHSGAQLDGADARLADAIIALRSCHDEAAVTQLSFAAQVSAKAHIAGMRATRVGGSEHEVTAAMLQVLRAAGLDDAYGPIVTVHGEVLHCHEHNNPLHDGDLLLADVGGETPEGWAADITRVWPVSGRYSATQRAIYEVVLQAEKNCIAAVKPGARYRSIQEIAKRTIVDGLVQLGIFRGELDGLLERGAAAVFFPHGVGHLLGLDVHDMEDLGDRAGYAPGRKRATNFGDAFLRLDRDLQVGMLVTIEPGFYQVPGIIHDPRYVAAVEADFDRDELAKYSDVRGIRIEDDVLVTAAGHRVLTSGVPKEANDIEALMATAD